jgi:hypothetical protein
MGRKKKELVSETNQSNEIQLDKMVLRSEEPTQEESSVYDPEAFRKSIKSLRGKKCPCCGRVAKFYHRKLSAKLCLALIHVAKWYRYDESQPDELTFFNIDDMFRHNPQFKVDFQKLLYWDLIEHKGRIETKGKKNPKEVFIVTPKMYRISENGIKFVQREIGIPITAIVYNGVVESHILFPVKTIDEILTEAEISYDQVIDSDYFIK